MLLFVAKSDAALEEEDHADPQAEAIVSTTESSIPETPAAAPIGASAAVLDSAIPADGSRSDPSSAPVEDAAAEAPSTQHFWEDPCAELARTWGLTRREQEVLVQLAQGRDLAFMEERFTLSRNTVKMHIRNVYAKLGVHGKQEVIDLVEATRHRGAPFSPVPKP
nr:helix-turn-helix transcriptional regulator [Adlercreutzia muris]